MNGDNMKRVYAVIKKIIFGAFVLFGYNMIATNFNLVIPINLITIPLVGFLGIPALFSLVLLFVILF
jgi:inhibitor of the pro-sigma K processing machinery